MRELLGARKVEMIFVLFDARDDVAVAQDEMVVELGKQGDNTDEQANCHVNNNISV